MEKSQKIILYSFIGLLATLMLILLIRHYPSIKNFIAKQNLSWISYKKNDVEFFYLKANQPKKIILIVPDQRMDKFWNTHNIETNQGLNLSVMFLQNDMIPIVYDRKDAYQEPHIFFSRNLLKDQLIQIFKEIDVWKKQNYDNLELIVFAHGDGCNIAMMALLEYSISNKMILSQCGYTNSLLDYYIELILNTMKITSVENSIIEESKKEAYLWKNQKEYEIIPKEKWEEKQKEYIENKVHPDLIAFRKTISRFQLPENIDFLKEAKNIYFYDLLKNLINKKNINIVHFISRRDEEMPEEVFLSILENQKNINSNYYKLFVVNDTDHFLFFNDKNLSSPIEILLHRSNPFKKLSEEFIKILLNIL